MTNYELTYLFSPDLNEGEINSLQEEIASFIQEKEGGVEKSAKPDKRELGYPIKKKRAAYLATLEFRFDPKEIKELEKKLKSKEQVLRFVILTKKAVKAKTVLRAIKPKIKPKKEKAELKEIEEKLEEILK